MACILGFGRVDFGLSKIRTTATNSLKVLLGAVRPKAVGMARAAQADVNPVLQPQRGGRVDVRLDTVKLSPRRDSCSEGPGNPSCRSPDVVGTPKLTH